MKKILVVDDNEMLCRLACDILCTEGYRAVPASNAAEALRALEEEEFDLLVTDSQMPGMSGLELARAARDRNPHFPDLEPRGIRDESARRGRSWFRHTGTYRGRAPRRQNQAYRNRSGAEKVLA